MKLCIDEVIDAGGLAEVDAGVVAGVDGVEGAAHLGCLGG